MDRQVGTEPRDDGITSGTSSRPGRDLTQPLVLDLAAEAGTLFEEPEWAERDRNSRTIASSDGLRITLTALRRGAEIGSEGTNDTLAVQVLRGSVGVDLGGGRMDLRQGQLATMGQPGRWRIEAADDALLLLTVSLGPTGSGR